ncbi:MAG: TrkA family potassium uptake protein [Anaerolineales bacterium]
MSAVAPEFAIIGLGRFGISLAKTLLRQGFPVLGIDRDPNLIQKLSTDIPNLIALDATNEDALREAGLSDFDTVIVAIGTDFESNLLTAVALKNLGVRRVICKAVTHRQRTILLKIGADQVVLPEMEAGQRLARELIAPGTLNQLLMHPEYQIVEVPLPAALIGKSLFESQLRNRYGINVLVIEAKGRLLVPPPASYRFQAEDRLVVLGSSAALASLFEP